MKTHKFHIDSQLRRVWRAWEPFFGLPCLDRPITGPLLAHSQLVIAHYRRTGRNTRMSPSPLNRSGERLHRGDIGSQMTVTLAGHHLGQELEKNNYHYPC